MIVGQTVVVARALRTFHGSNLGETRVGRAAILLSMFERTRSLGGPASY